MELKNVIYPWSQKNCYISMELKKCYISLKKNIIKNKKNILKKFIKNNSNKL